MIARKSGKTVEEETIEKEKQVVKKQAQEGSLEFATQKFRDIAGDSVKAYVHDMEQEE